MLTQASNFCSVAAIMVESDIREKQQNPSFFNIQNQMSSEPENCTGLSSEERLVEEAVLVNELNLMIRMLACLIKFQVSNITDSR